jgi:hypothetical protein
VAKDNNLTLEDVKKMYQSEFSCLAEFMSKGIHDQPETFKNINFIKLGKFYANKNVIERMVLNKRKKLVRLQQEAQRELLENESTQSDSGGED